MKSTGMFVTLVTLATIVVPATHAVENPVLSLDQVLEQFQWDFESTAIRTESEPIVMKDPSLIKCLATFPVVKVAF